MELPKLAEYCGQCKTEKAVYVLSDKVKSESVCNKCLQVYQFPTTPSCTVCGKEVETKHLAVYNNIMLVTCTDSCQAIVQKLAAIDFSVLTKPVSQFLHEPCCVCKKTSAVKEIQSYNRKFSICAQCPDTNLIVTEKLNCWTCRNPIKSDYCHYEMTYEKLAFKFIFCKSECMKIHKKEMTKNLDKLSVCRVCNTRTTQTCAGCKSIHYCSQQCQKKDWSSHKKTCKR